MYCSIQIGASFSQGYVQKAKEKVRTCRVKQLGRSSSWPSQSTFPLESRPKSPQQSPFQSPPQSPSKSSMSESPSKSSMTDSPSKSSISDSPSKSSMCGKFKNEIQHLYQGWYCMIGLQSTENKTGFLLRTSNDIFLFLRDCTFTQAS
jgi:hypothetical protein